jgi:co-chaperonin GroES (HSP10)
MKAIGVHIIIVPIDEQIENDAGIIITSSLDKNVRHKKGKVITCGDKVTEVKDGDIVYYDFARSSPIRIGSEKYMIVDEPGIVIVE